MTIEKRQVPQSFKEQFRKVSSDFFEKNRKLGEDFKALSDENDALIEEYTRLVEGHLAHPEEFQPKKSILK